MSESAILHETPPDPKTSVEQFITTVWEHPLLDEKTKEHRKKALEALPPFMEKFGVDPSEYIATLYGSSLWITGEDSDFDFHIIKFDPIDHPDDGFSRAEVAARKEKSKIHHHAVGIDENSEHFLLNYHGNLFNLLLTPDEYLVGNIDKARQLRLRVIDEIGASPELIERYWEQRYGTIQTLFENNFKSWAERSWVNRMTRILGKEEGVQTALQKQQSRQGRLQQNLQVRANAAFNPNWREDFLEAFNKLSVPPFATYADALRQTQGALHVNPRFAAHTIEQALTFRKTHSPRIKSG